jgi:hypothetical protein
MASISGLMCAENEVQLVEIVCTIILDEVDLLEINPTTDFILQKITMTSSVGSDMHQEIAMTFKFCRR